jgi:predicted metal-dependent phosphoesterase TrpH
MNAFRADLHCHTTCSDGTFTPVQITQFAYQIGLKGLSITDHDTITAYLEAMPVAQKIGLPLLSGVEFSTVLNQHSVHVLAYSFALNSSIIHQFCERHQKRRQERNRTILELINKQGMPLTEEDLQEQQTYISINRTLGRPHIALAMMKKGYVTSIQEAFLKYLGEGKPCYTLGQSISVEETLSIIHQANGFAIIAHPHLILESHLIRHLLDMPFDGIEGYYGRFTLSQQERWIKIGRHRQWLVTGGSDFHGEIKPNLPLGSSWVNEDTFQILYERFQTNQT